MADAASELLFAYGTLLLPTVQLELFGRRTTEHDDVLPGFTVDYAEIEDPRVVELSGASVHPVLRRTDQARDKVTGKALELTEDELDAADEYEVALYSRVRVALASGRLAWVYVA